MTRPEPPAVPGYDLRQVIGEGATGSVWRAVPRAHPGRLVAVKVLHPGAGIGWELIEHEAAALRALEHPNVLDALDVVPLPTGGLALVTPFAAGGSLAARIAAGTAPRDAADLTALGARIAGALAAAHTAGLVHRDVKPANILFDREDRPLLADLGTATLLGDQHHDVVGTPGYVDPRVVDGHPADHRTDLYALGVTLYETAAGVPPYAGASADRTLDAARGGAFVPLDRHTDLPIALVQLIEALFAADPHLRPQRADDVAARLDEFHHQAARDRGHPDPPVGRGRAGVLGATPVGFPESTHVRDEAQPPRVDRPATPPWTTPDRERRSTPQPAPDPSPPRDPHGQPDPSPPRDPHGQPDRLDPLDRPQPHARPEPHAQPGPLAPFDPPGPDTSGDHTVVWSRPAGAADIGRPDDLQPGPQRRRRDAATPRDRRGSDSPEGQDRWALDDAELREPGRPRWPILVGAGLLAAIVGLGALVVLGTGSTSSSDDPRLTPVTEADAADEAAARRGAEIPEIEGSGPDADVSPGLPRVAPEVCSDVNAGLGQGTADGGVVLTAADAAVRVIADVDGTGCGRPLTWEAGVLQIATADGEVARFRLDAEEGDVLLVGDWSCDGRETPALYRPVDGRLFTFSTLADPGEEVTVRGEQSGVVGGTPQVRVLPDGCATIVLTAGTDRGGAP